MIVFDFSDKTIEEFNVLYKNNKGNICGRFREDQINQDLKYIAAFKRNTIIVRVRRIASFLITIITLKIVSIRDGFSQAAANNNTSTEMVVSDPDRRKKERSEHISGQVRSDNTENGVVNASVKLYDCKGNLVASATTVMLGYFNLHLPPSVNPDQTFLLVVEKAKEKGPYVISRYSKLKKKITQKDFDSVLLSMKAHSRTRRNIIGRKPRLMGCPAFR